MHAGEIGSVCWRQREAHTGAETRARHTAWDTHAHLFEANVAVAVLVADAHHLFDLRVGLLPARILERRLEFLGVNRPLRCGNMGGKAVGTRWERGGKVVSIRATS